MTKEELESNEEHYFQQWLDDVYNEYPREELSFFEHNLDVIIVQSCNDSFYPLAISNINFYLNRSGVNCNSVYIFAVMFLFFCVSFK
jgi:hypothetical protein